MLYSSEFFGPTPKNGMYFVTIPSIRSRIFRALRGIHAFGA